MGSGISFVTTEVSLFDKQTCEIMSDEQINKINDSIFKDFTPLKI